MPHFSLRSIAAVLTAVALMQGCGGGNVTYAPLGNAGSGSAPGGAALFATTTLNGTVVLPAGMHFGAGAGALTVLNSVGSTPVGSTGAFTLRTYSDGPQLTLVIDKNGSPLLMGFVSQASTTVDVNSTAAALLFFATASFALTSDLRDQALALIPSAPGIGALASGIASALAANPDAFATSNAAVAAQLQSVVAALIQTSGASSTAAGRRLSTILTSARGASASVRSPQGVRINPPQPASGLTPLIDFPSGFHFENALRRPADLYIDRISFVDAQGNTQPNPISLTPSGPLPIPPTTGVSTTLATLVDIVSGKYAYAPVDTATTALPLVANSQSTLYQLTTVGPGLNAGAIASVTPEEQQDQEDISVEFLMLDMALPLLLEFALPGHDIDHALGVEGLSDPVIHDLVHAAENVPGVAAAAENGQWGQALQLVLAQVNVSQSALALALQTVVTQVLLNEGINAQKEAFNIANQFLVAVRVADQILTAFDASVTEAGLVGSDEADIWMVTVLPDPVTLTPPTINLLDGTTQNFTANVPSQSGSNSTLVWTWTNTATSGHLTDGVAGHSDNFTSSHNTVTYTANPVGSGTDTITVTAFLIQGQGRVQVGSQTATVTVFATPSPSPSPSTGVPPLCGNPSSVGGGGAINSNFSVTFSSGNHACSAQFTTADAASSSPNGYNFQATIATTVPPGMALPNDPAGVSVSNPPPLGLLLVTMTFNQGGITSTGYSPQVFFSSGIGCTRASWAESASASGWDVPFQATAPMINGMASFPSVQGGGPSLTWTAPNTYYLAFACW